MYSSKHSSYVHFMAYDYNVHQVLKLTGMYSILRKRRFLAQPMLCPRWPTAARQAAGESCCSDCPASFTIHKHFLFLMSLPVLLHYLAFGKSLLACPWVRDVYAGRCMRQTAPF